MTVPSTDGGGPDARQYDAIGARSAAAVAASASNAEYERPATIALLGDVAGRHVLDVGCAPGLLSAWLVERGAIVTAFDASVVMAEQAKQAVADRARVFVAELGAPLPLAADRHFDLMVASLVLHYVEDRVSVFGEFRRVLAPGGAVVFSTHHPAWTGRPPRRTTSRSRP
jgi:SAM-dependent methyltransferase